MIQAVMSFVPRLGVLGSGSGSNCQSIFDAIDSGRLNAEVAIVLSDNPNAYILERAKKRGVKTAIIDCRGFKSKFPDESQHETAELLKSCNVDLVCLAGFMRLVKSPLLQAFPNRILNIHPSLLPAFPGLQAWTQAVEAGVSESGVTVHYVDAGMDTGSMIGQVRVPVMPDDTPETLHARIQEQEHILYPRVIGEVLAQLQQSA